MLTTGNVAAPSLDELRLAWSGLEGIALLRRVLTGPLAERIALVSSFGAESAVLLDMIASIDPRTPVVFLDTGKLFQETLDYRDELVALLGLQNVRSIRPEASEVGRHDPAGDLWSHEPDMCCHIRKTEPLDRALLGYVGWITGRKRFQGGMRTSLPTLELDSVSGLLKINPLADWSIDDIKNYRRLRGLPSHPLVAKGFASIGCAPCTRPIKEGEDQRAGRWWQIDKSECGIHRPNFAGDNI